MAHAPITDSPWFWLLVFSVVGIGALAAISGKYGRRQANIERQYQARERIAQGDTISGDADTAQDGDSASRRSYSMPGETLIPLWPLAVGLGAIALFAAVMLARERGRGRPGSQTDEGTS
ncbi:MAG TPA: hypothetical protein VII92_18990 [Anaerolineae bacterium]